MNHRNLLALVSAALLAAAASPNAARAQVLLKPNGQNAAPLRVKSLTIRAEIERERFATTKYDILFQNEVSERVEADFLYTLPSGAVVTDFAYYYGDERVPARIAEKERAALIYKYITTRMRDPALVEMVGKNTFRARIFPVMPNADLRVQITMVQALPSNGKTTTYTLPLKPDSKTAPPLDKIDVGVHVVDAPSNTAISTNYGVVAPSAGVKQFEFAFKGENYRATKDLRITLTRPAPVLSSPTLSAAVYAAPSGGADGFFALSLAPNRALVQPVVKIAGVKTYQVSSAPQVARAGQAFVITGRYKGAGRAVVSVSGAKGGATLTESVLFGSASVQNNAASKLWASGRIAALSLIASKRAEVVALSFRYAMPSKFTSWIAIPEAERKRYKDEKDQAEVDNVARKIAGLIKENRGQSAEARALRVRLTALCKRLGRDPRYALQGYLGGRMEEISSRIAEIEYGRKTRASRTELAGLRRELARLSDATGLPADQYLRERRRYKADGMAREAAEQYVALARRNQENTARARALRATLSRHSLIAGQSAQDYVRYALSYYQSDLVEKVINLRHGAAKTPPPTGEEARLVQEIAHLERIAGLESGSTLRGAEENWAYNQTEALARKLADEIRAGHENEPVVQKIHDNIVALTPKNGEARAREVEQNAAENALYNIAGDYVRLLEEQKEDAPEAQALQARISRISQQFNVSKAEILTRAANYPMQNLAYQQRAAQNASRLNPARIAEIERSMSRLESATGVSAQKTLKDVEQQYYTESGDDIRRELLAEVRKPDPNSVKIADAEKRLRAALPTWKPEGYNEARIERLKTDAEIDRLTLNPSPQDEAEKARRAERVALLTKRSEELYARMGDPLVTVDAPRDARQVVALFPSGDTKPLEWDATTAKWQARFDIPTYATEGEYVVTVVVLDKTGKRETRTFTYHVDVTKPRAQTATATLVTGNKEAAGAQTLRLEIAASSDTARVTVVLPWGDTATLAPVPGSAGRFFALIAVPARSSVTPGDALTFTLTDRAHNRAEATALVTNGDAKPDALGTAARR